jgi:hypothetical protein
MQNDDIRVTDVDRRGDDVENIIFVGERNLTQPLESSNLRSNIREDISKVLANPVSIVGYALGCLTALGVVIDCVSRDNDLECNKKNMPFVAIPVGVCLGIASSLRILKNNYPEQYQRIFSGVPTATLGFVNTESRTITQPESTQPESARRQILPPSTSLVLFASPSRSEPVQANANSIVVNEGR